MKNFNKFFFLVFTVSLFTITACDDDNGGPTVEQEVITTVKLTFADGANSATFTSSDPDGDGGNPPTTDDISLDANTAYSLSIEFLDESNAADVKDITEEVKEEELEHMVCFEASSSLPSPTALDTDANGDPLGLNATFTTGDVATGTLQVSLKHEPDKASATPCSTGETDVEVVFEVVVE